MPVGKFKMQIIASKIRQTINNDKIGFVLITFPFFDPGGTANYISNSKREDIIKALRETADKLENHEDTDTPTVN